MYKVIASLALVVAAVAAIVVFTTSNADTATAQESSSVRFSVGLSGDQEVSEVITNTTGSFRMRCDRNLASCSYVLHVFDGVGVTQAHIHCGMAGQNGNVVAFVAGAFPTPVDVDGLLAQGTLTNDDIISRDCDLGADPDYQVNNIASLATAGKLNGLYVNVHTTANPPGEVRGQLFEE